MTRVIKGIENSDFNFSKTGYINGDDVMVAKIAGGGNPNFGNSGMMLIFDQLSLRLNTLLLDEGVLTEIRTAAASVLGSKTLLGSKLKNVQSIGIVGAGIQARWQLRFLALITDCRNVKITSRTTESCLRIVLEIFQLLTHALICIISIKN